ncbi:Uncharacterised protein [Chlamydia trachomatis]|nr:Uncharacterised protein [Chlamydia trachomatis]
MHVTGPHDSGQAMNPGDGNIHLVPHHSNPTAILQDSACFVARELFVDPVPRLRIDNEVDTAGRQTGILCGSIVNRDEVTPAR